MEHFEIGDKVRLKDIADSFGLDIGVGTVKEIFTDYEDDGEDEIWTDEDGYLVPTSSPTGTYTLQVSFPGYGIFTLPEDRWKLVFSAKHF